jgi:hypothetical protein
MNVNDELPTRALPTAVMIDTNAFHEGRLTQTGLKSLRTLVQLGLHVMVPDLVCRELASHAFQDYETARELLTISGINDEKIGDVDSIFNLFSAKIEQTGAKIIVSSVSHLRDSILAQIDRTPPASPKNEVTTGAVDYVVFLHALEATHRFSTVAVVTGDRILGRSLGSHPGVQIFEHLAQLRKGDGSHMRIELDQALTYVERMLSPSFEAALRAKLGASSVRLVGIGDLLRINDTDMVAYIDVSRPVFDGSGSEYYGNSLDRLQLTLQKETLAIKDFRNVSSDPFDYWPDHVTAIDEYLSVELSMVPSIMRPVPQGDFVSEAKTPLVYAGPDGSQIQFALKGEIVAEVRYSEYTLTKESEYQGNVLLDKERHTEIFLMNEGEMLSGSLKKGSLARLIMSQALRVSMD